MRDYKNILVVNPYGIGDVLFSSVVVRNLKTNFPSCKINMLLGSR